MNKKRNEKIDTRVPPYLRPRPLNWPADCFCREYFSEKISEFYQVVSNCLESYSSPWTKRWLIDNDRLLKEQRDEVSPVFSQTKEEFYVAKFDAREDMRALDKEEKLDRRDAAVEAGTCDGEYTGNCKDECHGGGIGGECNKCSGQVIKAGGTIYTKPKNRHVDSGAARFEKHV